ncbi:hypothetical protein JWG45_05225 [Leptospira sp. 201903070]|uniref:Uncharacterized protein n=1 Tax=Leptospira ainlahdjerensis TaxID=2810033 RepID=A0ABS2U857_9LEPT|nr:hypothetical protein [Leptospira ainlahdjerensis]MBM9576552.1 hypothetical protein [Leptospira ainlahdjerensis]
MIEESLRGFSHGPASTTQDQGGACDFHGRASEFRQILAGDSIHLWVRIALQGESSGFVRVPTLRYVFAKSEIL